MTPHLPPLTEKIGRGAPGGHEFERLLHQLLLRHADKNGYVYEPTHANAPVDGIAPALFTRYYPHAARPLLNGYDGFDFATFAKQYREKLALAHRKLRTLGLPPETLREHDAAREIRLRDVFVPLKLVPRGETESRPLVDFLDRGRSLVVLGDPGTGKPW